MPNATMQIIIPPANIHIDKGNQIFDGVFNQSLGFRIKLDYDAAIQFIRRIGRYNDFVPELVIDALECVDRLIPRKFYCEGNPNNGERRYDISVGREGSPVIYLDCFEFLSNDPLNEATMKAVCSEMEIHGIADEASYDIQINGQHTRKITFRFWWD